MAGKDEVKKLVTPRFRVAFSNVFKARAAKPGDDPKYGLTAIFPVGADLTTLKQLAKEACVKTWGADPAQWPSGLKSPFRKGEEKAKYEGFEPGTIFVSMTSKFQPQIIAHDKRPILVETEFYSGVWARATIHAYTYDKKGNKGVAFGLNNLQKLGDAKPFAGRADAAEDFETAQEIPYEGAAAPTPQQSGGADSFLD